MARRRIRRSLIANQTKRNSTFEKRTNSLFKKANELSILCGVEIGVVVHNRGGENNTVLWPSPQVFNERLQRFLEIPDVEGDRRTETLKSHMERILNSEMENVAKSKNKLEMKMSEQLLGEVTQGKDINELDLQQLLCVNLFAEEMLKKLQKREDELNNIDPTNIAP